jgi:hypothetical protein
LQIALQHKNPATTNYDVKKESSWTAAAARSISKSVVHVARNSRGVAVEL